MIVHPLGTAEGTRTPDLLIRSQSLYPTELLPHTHLKCLSILAQDSGKCKHFLKFLKYRAGDRRRGQCSMVSAAFSMASAAACAA